MNAEPTRPADEEPPDAAAPAPEGLDDEVEVNLGD